MNTDSQKTLLEKNAILDAIDAMRQEVNGKIDALHQEVNGKIDVLRQEMNVRFDQSEARLTSVETRLTGIEARLRKVEFEVEEIKNSQFSFDVRLERVEADTHALMSIGHNLRADVKILRAEVGAWAKDVMRLETQMA